MHRHKIAGRVSLTLFAGMLATARHGMAEEKGYEYRWHVSAGAGWLDYENDEPVDDAELGYVSVGYDLNRQWTLEGVLEFTPELESSYRGDWATGARISRLSESAGRTLEETSAVRFAIDGLFHLAPESRIDPYLAAGLGVAAYENDFDQRYEPLARAGAGVFAHLNDRCALRLDCRGIIAGRDTEFNLVTTAGVMFSFGGKARPASDLDSVEKPATEVQRFELNLSFDPGKWDIKPEYRSELDVIGRLLETKPSATARIDGHEQASDAVSAKDAQRLSEKRAAAVRDYLKDNWKIRSSRMQAQGFGTSRPKPDPAQSSQRIEVFVTVP